MKKPVLQDDVDSCNVVEKFNLKGAPSYVDSPSAYVTQDFQKTAEKVLAVLPEPQAPEFSLNDCFKTPHVIQWGVENSYAMAVFTGHAVSELVSVWDDVMRGCPARFLAVLVTPAALPLLHAALSNLHPLLYTRLQLVCVIWGKEGDESPDWLPPPKPKELCTHLKNVLMHLPPTWAGLTQEARHFQLFEFLQSRIDDWETGQGQNYATLQTQRQEDIGNLHKLSIPQNLDRLDRRREEADRTWNKSRSKGNEQLTVTEKMMEEVD